MPILYRKVFSLLSVLLIISIILTGVAPLESAYAASPYVSAQGTSLYLNGEPYQFIGVNAFNLGTYAGANAGCGSQVNDLDAFFSQLRPNSMVRVWAFQGGITTNVTTKQTDWTGLDRVVNTAQKDGIKLILVLGDQAGACDDGHWRDVSWYTSGYKQAFNDYGNGLTPIPYLDYVKLVVARYKDSPAVAMWEPINEPEAANCQSGTGTACYAHQTCDEPAASQAMRSFFDDIGTTIKSIDPNHLVSSGVGGDGQCGAVYGDYQYIHAGPGIDVATYHDYDRDNEPMPGDPWNGLQERLNQMKQINKPLIIEEAGIIGGDNATGCVSLSTRMDEFKAKIDAAFIAGAAGYMPWDLTGGTPTGCNFSIGDNDPLLGFLHNYPVSMSTFFDTSPPTAPINLVASGVSGTQVTLNWTAATDNVGVVRYDVFNNDAYFTSTTATSMTLTGLSPATTYIFSVKAKDAAFNNSDSSNEVTVTTSAAQ